MKIEWPALASAHTDTLHGSQVEMSGWAIALADEPSIGYFLLTEEAPCCTGCLPADPLACLEVYLAAPVARPLHAITVRGELRCLSDDPAGWRYQLVDARVYPHENEAESAGAQQRAPRSAGRRTFLTAGAALGLAGCAPGRFAAYTDNPDTAGARAADNAPAAAAGTLPAWQAPGTLTIDMHSHGGRVIVSRNPSIGAARPFVPLAAPMRDGGMNVVCLAIVTDTLVTRVSPDRKRFEAYRDPAPGELYALSQTEFARARTLIEREQLHVITDRASLQASGARGPSVIVSCEGADFLEGRLERVDEAYVQHRLRHLQLTHYRVNELGDIQTAAPVHGGLTDFGAEVVRRCNSLGIVVDVAHGPYALVKRAAAVTSKPLVLSHTALTSHPSPRSRMISPEHARVIAGTGGVIGVWPSSGSFADLDAMAAGVRRMADVVGVAHVGLGTDLFGFISPPVFGDYRQLPALADALLRAGFTPGEVGKILGENYRRVFEATV